MNSRLKLLNLNKTKCENFFVFFFVVTTFFISFLPTEIITQKIGGRSVKLGIWFFLISVSALILFINIKKINWKNDVVAFVFLSFFLFGLYAGVQALLRPPAFDCKQTLVAVFFIPLFCLLGLYSSRHKKTIIKTLLALSFIYILLSLYSFCTGHLSLSSRGFQTIVPSSWYKFESAGYQGTSFFISIFIVITLTWCIISHNKFVKKLFYITAVCYSLPLLFIMGGRSATAALFVALLFVIIVKIVPVFIKFLVKKNDVLWLGISLILVIGLIVYAVVASELLFFRRFSVIFEGGDRTLRIFLFTSAIDLWLQNAYSFIVGIGPQQFPIAIGQNSPGMYPHNFLLETLCEYGLLGFVLIFFPFLLLGLIYLKKILCDKLKDPNRITLSALAVLFFSVSMFTGSLASVWTLIFIVSSLAPSKSVNSMSFKE